ncbi:MAG: hypothetical protein PQJ60_13295 [Spirochaetales bacterium]|nr:hypothetical protein [Spirochaetales bacterium]
MNSATWISLQNDQIQMEFWKRFSHFLNDRELSSVMADLERGIGLYEAHVNGGLLEKYQLEVFKLIQTLSRLYPDDAVNPFL